MSCIPGRSVCWSISSTCSCVAAAETGPLIFASSALEQQSTNWAL